MRDHSPNLRLAKAGLVIRWLTASPNAAVGRAGLTSRNAVAFSDIGSPRNRPCALVAAAGPWVHPTSIPSARDALDLLPHQTLDQRRQVVVEPVLQHWAQHLLHQVLERLGVRHQNRVGERVE